MPTFAELKAKAAGVSSAGVEKFQNAKDRHTSVPLAKTNWDPYSGQGPPPPPPSRSLVNQRTKPALSALPPPPSRTSSVVSSSSSRTSSAASAPRLPSRGPSSTPPPPPPRGDSAAPPPPPRSSSSQYHAPSISAAPPPIKRSTRPDAPARSSAPLAPREPQIDWTNLSQEDKEVFFSWLDEFFATFTPPIASESNGSGRAIVSHAKPSLRTVTKPRTYSLQRSQQTDLAEFTLSHPPPSQYGSAALDLAHYFAPSTPWNGAWYNKTGSPSIPPSLVGRTDHTYTSSWRSRGSNKTTHIGVFFADLSFFWGTVDFTTTNPDDPLQVKRDAIYLPPPQALGKEELVDAHEMYGETIALFAESFLGSGQCCARGECWDLANEALKYFADFDYIPKPIPSVSRTHGHLIYEAKADSGGGAVGRWRGGDDRVRRGDIVEWRRVKVGIKDARPGSFYTLGDPDHTAVIVEDSIPGVTPSDGERLNPSDLGSLTVIEQSQGQLPEKRTYQLSLLEEGEMWIYRPISMKAYLGLSDITAVPPSGINGLQRL